MNSQPQLNSLCRKNCVYLLIVKVLYCVLVMGPSLENSHLSIRDVGLPVSLSHAFLEREREREMRERGERER